MRLRYVCTFAYFWGIHASKGVPRAGPSNVIQVLEIVVDVNFSGKEMETCHRHPHIIESG